MLAILSTIRGLTAIAMATVLCLIVLQDTTAPEPVVSNARVDTGRSEKATAATLQPLKPRIPVEVIRIIDGDTVEVRAHIWLDQHVTTKVRIRSIDAPERKARCPLEAQMAEISRDRLVTLMGTGPAFLTDLGQDKYGGRVLGSLLTSRGEDVGAILVASGHARTYSGGRRQGWC